MGDEADADWQGGLIEAGIEDAQRWLVDRMESSMMMVLASYTKKQRQTALRVHGRSFETVELDDQWKIIEPVRCICGAGAIMHQPKCPFYGLVT